MVFTGAQSDRFVVVASDGLFVGGFRHRSEILLCVCHGHVLTVGLVAGPRGVYHDFLSAFGKLLLAVAWLHSKEPGLLRRVEMVMIGFL